jgi:preprotein translocase subunit SecA
MDDELMRLFGGDKMKNLMTRIGMAPGEPIFHPWLNKSIEGAQKKVEERNFEIRKHLLEYDDVLNQQRKFIYEQRDAILTDSDLKKRVNDATADMASVLIDEFSQSQKQDFNAAFKNFAEQLRTKFGYQLTLDQDSSEVKNPELLEKRIIADLEKDITDKEALIGTAYLDAFIRDSYLHSIDRRWLDHLENMEALREAVYLRHYAQKNPLTEYKLEGFQIFDRMIDGIREEIASRLHLIRIQIAPNDGGRERKSVSRSFGSVQSANHSSMGSFGAASFGGAASGTVSGSGGGAGGVSQMHSASRPGGATVVRTQPKVGRNDPCPCGSGKKYKFCHGR